VILDEGREEAAIREVLAQRQVAAPPRPRDVLRHLRALWPGGLVYNAWYYMHTARSLGLLDAEFRPIAGARPVSEGARRIREASALGGFPAVVAYVQAAYRGGGA
jgi:hypothetical protein